MTSEVEAQAMLKAVAAFGPMLLRILAARVLTFLAMAGALGLFITAISQGTLMSLGVAGAYTALVFLPVLVKDAAQAGK